MLIAPPAKFEPIKQTDAIAHFENRHLNCTFIAYLVLEMQYIKQEIASAQLFHYIYSKYIFRYPIRSKSRENQLNGVCCKFISTFSLGSILPLADHLSLKGPLGHSLRRLESWLSGPLSVSDTGRLHIMSTARLCAAFCGRSPREKPAIWATLALCSIRMW